jgi:hypothetical protein
MSDTGWSEPTGDATAAEAPDPESIDTTQDAPAASPKRAGTPAWAWALMGMLALAIVAGGVWIAYTSGVAAGQRGAALSSETPTAVVAEVVTPTVVPLALPEADEVDPGAGETVVADEPEPPAADPPADSGGSAGTKNYDLSIMKPLDLQPVAPTVPTTWKVIFKFSNTGPWEMPNPPGAPLNAGYLRMTVLATDNGNNSGYVQLKRVDGGTSLPNYGILYDWPASAGNVVYKVTAPILVETGTYQLRVSIHGPWTIILEK